MKDRDLPTHVYRSHNKFLSIVRHKTKRHYLGIFDTPEEASAMAQKFREENPNQKIKKTWKPGDEV